MPRKQCKYCLESNFTRSNRFITPCECNGSVKYVHYRCFLKWIIEAPEDKKSLCPICNYTYSLNPLEDLETIPDYPPRRLRLVAHPVSSVIASNFLFALVILSNKDMTLKIICNLYAIDQSVYYSYWLYTFIKSMEIKNKIFYLETMVRSYYHCYILGHIWLLTLLWFYPSHFTLVAPLTGLSLPFYWERHIYILRQMNSERMAILLPP